MFKVLHAFDVSIPVSAGYTFRSRAIINQQRALGWSTFHVTSSKQGSPATSDVVDGLTFERTQPTALSKLPVVGHWDVVRTLVGRIKEIAQRNQVDVIHAHSPFLIGLAACKAGRALGIPVVYECRAFWEDAAVDTGHSREGDLRYRLTRTMETKVFRRADAAVCISKGLHQDIVARGVDLAKLFVVGNAVNMDEFRMLESKNPELEDKFKLQGKKVLGFIGSFFAYEGIEQLVRAIPKIKVQIPNIHLLLVGGGNEESNLKTLVKSLDLEADVTFVGRVGHKEVPTYASLIDAFVFPRQSLRLTELVTPLKPLECMAQGKLVVASDVGGHKELIDHGKTGYLFKADDLPSLTQTIVEALNDVTLAKQIVQNGLVFVGEMRSWDKNVLKYEQVYRAAMRKSTLSVSASK